MMFFVDLQFSKRRKHVIGTFKYGMDIFVLNRGLAVRKDVVNDLVFHPTSNHTASTQHHYLNSYKCYEKRRCNDRELRCFQTYFNNSHI